jgi:hypothetical protein
MVEEKVNTSASTARMAFHYVLPDSLLHFGERSGFRRLIGEECGMSIVAGELS